MSGWSAGYTNTFGSYDFIGAQTAIVTLWISMNLAAVAHRWDPYPYPLNLVFGLCATSAQAEHAGGASQQG